MKTAKIVVRLDPDEKARLRSISQESGETMSETVRGFLQHAELDPELRRRIRAAVDRLLPAINQALLELETEQEHV